MKNVERVVKAFIGPAADGFYVAECLNLPVVTQGKTLDETVRHLQEAVSLALEDGDFKHLGFSSETPPIIVTLELPARAA